jgi:hypothetical protein
LIKQESIGIDGFQLKWFKNRLGEVAYIGSYYRLCPTVHRRGNDMPVVQIRQDDLGFDRFPSSNKGIFKSPVHIGESLAHVEAGMNLLDRRLRLEHDPLGPQGAVQIFLRYAQQRVS